MLFRCSVVSDSLQPLGLQHTGFPAFTISQSLFKLMSIELVMPSHPLLPPSPSGLNLSQHQILFQWVSSLHQVPKYWRFSFSISPSNEYSGLISFRIDWLDLLVVQGTLQSLLQHHNSKASILWCSVFFMGDTSTLKWICHKMVF